MKHFSWLLVFLPLLGTQTAPQDVRIVRVSRPADRGPAEVSIAINPSDPLTIVGASLSRGESNRTYLSRDGGSTWRTLPSDNPDRRTQGDDAVVFDGAGRVYHSYISFVGLRQKRPDRASNGIFVRRSEDGGENWAAPVPVVDHINTLTPFEDKPYMAVDTDPVSPGRGRLYVAWTRFDEYGSDDPECRSRILFSLSSDFAESFESPIQVSDRFGDCRDQDDTVEGAVPAVGPGGTVYLAWAGPSGLVFDMSEDQGLTFGADRTISDNPQGWDIPLPGMRRHNGLPVTDVDLSSGRFRGRIYVNWIDLRFGDADVFVIHSSDRGATWSAPVRVNDDPQGNGRHQLFTWMAVDPVDGSINVIFYDRRDQKGTEQGLTLARSVDGGQTFVNHRLPVTPFRTQPRVFFGDYIGIDAWGGRVIPFYTHQLDSGGLAVSVAPMRFETGTQRLIPSTATQ